jgi:hypothetical protein
MAHHQAHPGSMFDPTLALATERMQARHQEAHGERLAALSTVVPSAPLRVRVGNALIALGSTLVTPVETRQRSLTD